MYSSIPKPRLIQYLRRTPKWRLAGSAYFLTWRLGAGRPELSPEERAIVAGAVKHFKDTRYRLFAFVVMNDHVHVILQPLGEYELSGIMHSIRSYTAHRIQKLRGHHGALWQEDYFDRIIRSEHDLFEKANYIVTNPQRRWPEVTQYTWAEWFELS